MIFMIKTDQTLLGITDASKLLNIHKATLHFYVQKYDIPYYETSSGKIFLKEDIEAFQEARKDKLKHRRKS